MKSRFISADKDRRPCTVYNLTDGDTITVKNVLNYGEYSMLYDNMVRSHGPGGTVGVTMGEWRLTRMLAYIANWSFNDEDAAGTVRRVPVNMDNIRRLDPETAKEINDILDKHQDEFDAQQKQEAVSKDPN